MAKLTINKNPEKGRLTNSGTKELAKMKLTNQITTSEPFLSLFPINPVILDSIQNSIRNNGFDNSQVLHIWKENNVLIDGHTRLKAAISCSLKQVPVYEHSFESEKEAMEYAINLQRNRRNLTDAEMMSCLSQLDTLKEPGRQLASNEANSSKGKSASVTAKLLGTSRSKVEKMRSIKKHAPALTLDEVKEGKKSINKAYQETVEYKKNKTEEVSALPSLPTRNIIHYEDSTVYLIKSVTSADCVVKIPVITFHTTKSEYSNEIKEKLTTIIIKNLESLLLKQ